MMVVVSVKAVELEKSRQILRRIEVSFCVFGDRAEDDIHILGVGKLTKVKQEP